MTNISRLANVHSEVSSNMAKLSEGSRLKWYIPALAKAYTLCRRSHHDSLVILDRRRSTDEAMQVLIDVGCGPGNSRRSSITQSNSAFHMNQARS